MLYLRYTYAMQPDSDIIPYTPGQPNAGKKIFKIVSITIAVILSVTTAIIVSILFGFFRPNYQKIFYDAVENHMSTGYISQKNTSKMNYMGSKLVAVVDSTSDFTNVKVPKTISHTTIEVAGKKIADYESITTKSYIEYAKIAQLGDGVEVGELKFDQNTWYEFASEEEASRVDLLQMTKATNTTFGELIVGRYYTFTRQVLLKMYKDKDCFRFDVNKDVKEEYIDGKNLVRYDVKLNMQGIREVNEEASSRLGIEMVANLDYDDSQFDKLILYIDKESGRFSKVEIKSKEGQVWIDMGYPSALNIEIPTETVPFSSVTKNQN